MVDIFNDTQLLYAWQWYPTQGSSFFFEKRVPLDLLFVCLCLAYNLIDDTCMYLVWSWASLVV